MGETIIEWTRGDDGAMGKTWNPLRGCTRISEGCRSCYAEGIAARFSGDDPKTGKPLAYKGLARMTPNGPRWTGKLMIVSAHMDDPIRWKKPRRIFVNSMSDLFHEKLTNDQIARFFRVMLNAPQHTYQVLTKRAQRMHDFLAWLEQERGEALPGFIWLGVSVEDQPNADKRLPWLAKVKAAVRFVSVEPQIGPVSLKRWLELGVNWVIVGGESGFKPRRFDVDWARQLVRECREAGAAPFVKQLGGAPFDSKGRWAPMGTFPNHGPAFAEWETEFAVREFPSVAS